MAKKSVDVNRIHRFKATSHSMRIRKEEILMLYLNDYQDWKYCITVHCETPLKLEYVEQRLAALVDPSAYGTQRFITAWGHEH